MKLNSSVDFIVYTGSTTEYQLTSELELSGSVGMEIIQRYLNKKYHLYIDNLYTNPILFELLHRNKASVCDTVCKNRHRLLPPTTKLKRADRQYRHTDILLTLKWQNKREVCDAFNDPFNGITRIQVKLWVSQNK